MYVKISEIVTDQQLLSMPREHNWLVHQLWFKVNLFRSACNIPFVINTPMHSRRGYRDSEQHRALYAELKKNPPMGSMHLYGAAVDIADKDGKIARWVLENLEFSEAQGLYYEALESTPGWLHCQILAPKSGKRFFLP